MDGGGRLSQKFGADLAQQNLDRGLPSGDAELPSKASLAVRRANVDSVRSPSLIDAVWGCQKRLKPASQEWCNDALSLA